VQLWVVGRDTLCWCRDGVNPSLAVEEGVADGLDAGSC
jgi:hypothetical protein